MNDHYNVTAGVNFENPDAAAQKIFDNDVVNELLSKNKVVVRSSNQFQYAKYIEDLTVSKDKFSNNCSE